MSETVGHVSKNGYVIFYEKVQIGLSYVTLENIENYKGLLVGSI